MNNTTIGAIIAKLRCEKKYSRAKVCRGLCSTQMLIKIENDNADTDKFMLDMLLQRLGKSPDRLEVILSDEEYEKIYARDYIEELIWKNEKKQAYSFLEEYEQRYAKDSNAQKMFVFRTKAYIYHFLEHDIKNAEIYIKKAISITLPEINEYNINEYLLAENEIENLLELGLCFFEKEMYADVEQLLKFCQKYIDENTTDELEYAKLNSKLSWLMAKLLIKNLKYIGAYQICENAMELLRKHGILYFMIPLLEQLMICNDNLGISGSKWEFYYNAILKLYNHYGEEWYCHNSIFHNCSQTCYYLASEFVKYERQAQKITQEKLIEGVYEEPENLSRMENGKAMPAKKKLEGLIKNLGFERGKYCGSAIVENFETLEIKYEIDILMGTGNFKEAKKHLAFLQDTLDCTKKMNLVAIDIYQTIISSECGEIDAKETCQKLSHLLEESFLMKDGMIYRVPFFNELFALNMICRNLRKQNKTQESIAIYDAIISAVDASKINAKYQNTIMSLVLANTSLITSDKERCNRGISFELYCGKGKMIYMYLISQIDLEHPKNNNRELVQMAFYLSDLFYRGKNKFKVKKFYEQTYGQLPIT